jgi:hypothetical protein
MGQDEAEIPRPVAIESDGTEQYRQMTVRERSRLRPQLLERLGWRYMPLWTIEVFTDPSACADRIGGYLGLEKPVRPARAVASPGFFDEDVTGLGDDSYGPAADEDGQDQNGQAQEFQGQEFQGREDEVQEFQALEDQALEDQVLLEDQDHRQRRDESDGSLDGENEYDGGIPDRKENAQ